MASLLRKGGALPNNFDEYKREITRVCATVIVEDGRYNYHSIKDALKWANLSVKRYIQDVAKIGNMVFLSSKDFNKIKHSSFNLDREAEINALMEQYNGRTKSNAERQAS